MPQTTNLVTQAKDRVFSILKPNTADDKLVSWIKNTWETKKKNRQWLEQQWLENLNFLLGDHYNNWNTTYNAFLKIPTPAWRVRLAVNLILPTIRTLVAKYLREKPDMWAEPSSGEDQDVMRARICNKIMKHLQHRMDFDELQESTLYWMLSCGAVFQEVAYNPLKGRLVREMQTQFNPENFTVEEMNIPVLDADGNPAEYHVGDVDIHIRSPFNIIKDDFSASWRDIQWLIDSSIMTLDEIKATWPKGNKVKGEEVHAYSFMDRKLDLFMTSGIAVDREIHTDAAIVRRLWHNPTPQFPRGRYVVEAGDKILHNGPLPYNFNKIPYEMYTDILIPGRFWPMTLIQQLIPLQKEFNRTISQMIEWKNLILKPKILIPQGADLDVDAWDNEPGEMIEYVLNFRPEVLSPPPWPAQMVELLTRIVGLFNEVSSIHSVSKATPPSASSSGVQILYLQDQDEQVIAPGYRRYVNTCAHVWEMVLQTAAQFMKDERVGSILGKYGEIESFAWSGMDIDINLSVRARYGEGMPTSRAARAQQMMLLISGGFLNPAVESEKRLAMESLEIGDVSAIFEQAHLDESEAMKENFLMGKGEIVYVYPYQNHFAHIAVLNRWRKTDDFKKQPPEIQDGVHMHAAVHESYIRPIIEQSMGIQPTTAEPAQMGPGAPRQPGIASVSPKLGAGGAGPQGSSIGSAGAAGG